MRIFPALSILFLFTTLGCGGCGDDPCDLGECPSGTLCLVSEFDSSQASCVTPDQACRPACQATERCNDQRECEVVEAQCGSAGESCDPRFATKDGFLCLDADGAGPADSTCLEFCNTDGTCDTGALCFAVDSPTDNACPNGNECTDSKVCDQGVCRDRVCRASECEGFVDGQKTCTDLYAENDNFPNGSQCIELNNGTNFCFPAGPKKIGESCESLETAFPETDFTNTCQTGALCINNSCREACSNDETCRDGNSCVIGEGLELGFCGQKCTPFSAGDCGSGSTCLPLEGGQGLCIEGGTKQAFEACQPGESECVDGTLCIPFETDLGRCQPLCDLSAGEANPDGSVGEFPQAQRDATCPQSELSGAFYRIHNSAELGTNIDVYLGDNPTPAFSNLELSGRSDGDTNQAGSQYAEIDPKQYLIKILPAGAPRTDPPLVELSANLISGAILDFFVIPVDQTPDKAELIFFSAANESEPMAGKTKLAVQHTLVDVVDIDLILVPVNDDLSDPLNQVEVANDLAFKSRSGFIEIEDGTYDILAFPKDDPRTSRTNIVATASGVTMNGGTKTLIVRGSADPDDLPLAAIDILEGIELPSTRGSGPRFSCVVLNNDVFGFCQQECFDDGSGFSNQTCQGDGNGCNPVNLSENSKWKNLCGPTGNLQIGEACVPTKIWDSCAEGLHCLEYGNTAEGFEAQARGRCQPLCISDRPNDSTLKCGSDQACQPLVYNDDYKMGECNYACDPDTSYQDLVCPAGLQSCKPIASQVPDIAGGTTPSIQNEQSFCSASGNIATGEPCSGSDCQAGNECMFPRSSGQSTFIASVASQYFGGPGLSPTCTPQCDPFDNDSSSSICANDETCLFNFPWSAEVGHCAKITETVAPLSECQNPGESCGPDSICVVNGAANICFQFCQYEGPLNGTLQASGCSLGSVCNPFVNDIGVCQPQ